MVFIPNSLAISIGKFEVDGKIQVRNPLIKPTHQSPSRLSSAKPKKKPTWSNIGWCSTTSAYSSTGPPRHGRVALRLVIQRHQIVFLGWFDSMPGNGKSNWLTSVNCDPGGSILFQR